MKEIVIASGKGGTGKTSLSAAFASLASAEAKTVLADCDVDAADLHLILSPAIEERSPFVSGVEARIDQGKCVSCGKCAELCRFGGILREGDSYRVDSCEGCGVCARFCPSGAISLEPRRCGEWFRSSTRFGPFVHARLTPLAENSGKLVALVRREARETADKTGAEYLLVDGCPGMGCSVISSITGADLMVAVAEPSVSGLHDLGRLLELAGHFKVRAAVALNKHDVNLEASRSLEEDCRERGIPFLGRIPYLPDFTRAQREGKSVIEIDPSSQASEHTRNIWRALRDII